MTDLAILHELLEADAPVPREQALDRLVQAGCVLDVDASRNVRLIRTGLGIWADYLEHLGIEARRIKVYRSTTSTQDAARAIGGDGLLVIADHQTAGRGRLGRRWLAPPGTAVMLSRVVADSSRNVDSLTFAVSVAVARTLDRWLEPLGKTAKIKWPNDVLVDDAKIAGILVETHHPSNQTHRSTPIAVVGIGLNVSLEANQVPEELRPAVTSLAMGGSTVDRLAVLAELIHQVDRVIETTRDQTDLTPLVHEWRERSTLIDHPVIMQSQGKPVSGTVVDLDPTAGLILRTHTGELIHLPAATTQLTANKKTLRSTQCDV